MTPSSDDSAIQAMIAFWFAAATKARWYKATVAFDDECRQRFAALHEAAKAGELAPWAMSADGALALVLLLDQIPRNIHRGTALAFETDPKAVTVAAAAIEQGFDQALDPEKRAFLYLPFMHSEVLADQERSLVLNQALGSEKALAYAVDHADIIRRFGRFPHRNAILGRENTEEEQAFLEAGAKTYGQSAS